MTSSSEQISKAFENGKIAGSWLITGGNDFEKKQFIYDTCSLLLNQSFNEMNTFHPDVKWLTCGLTDDAKKEIQKNILAGKSVMDMDELAHKKEITVDDIRQGIQFLSLKTSPDRWKILVVDTADKMNENAANALLKALEEPNDRCIIFLLCQNIGKLLPTIKSRCRKIVLKPLSKDELAKKIQQLYPTLDDVETVVRLSDGSVGLAKDICDNDGLTLYRTLEALLIPLEQLSPETVKDFVNDIADRPVAFELTKKFLFHWLADQARQYALLSPFKAEDFIDLYQEATALFTDIDRIYLDKKQVLQTVLFKIAEVLS